MSKKFKQGQLVKIHLGEVNWTKDGFATIGSSKGAASLYEFIDLVTYPSFNDFLGQETLVEDGSIATILKYVGRPSKISRDPAWFEYDVYEILINGIVCQAFKQNLKPFKK